MSPLAIAVWILGEFYYLMWLVLRSMLEVVVQLVDLRQDCAEEEPEEQLLALKSYRTLSVSQPCKAEAEPRRVGRSVSGGKKIDARLKVWRLHD